MTWYGDDKSGTAFDEVIASGSPDGLEEALDCITAVWVLGLAISSPVCVKMWQIGSALFNILARF